MTLQLYNIYLPDAATREPPDDATQANVQLAGLLDGSGLVAEKVATESVDLTVRGQWHLADPLPEKFADELRSLAASDYEGVALWDTDGADPKQGYYEVESVDVNPDHQSNKIVYQYAFGLNAKGTHETHWRAVRTNVETVSTGLATGSGGQVAIEANGVRKVRWFDPANGTEAATVQSSAQTDHGAVNFYDPSEPTFDNPTLLYEIPFEEEWRSDVTVYDDAGRDRERDLLKEQNGFDGGFQYDTAQYDTQNHAGDDSTTLPVIQWVHVYHAGYEFDGRMVVDTSRLRVTFDESAGEIVATRYDPATDAYQSVSVDHSDYDLFDAETVRIGPAETRVFSEWLKTDGSIDSAVLSFQRGREDVVVRVPDAESSIDADLESLLNPIASDQTDDPTPNQSLTRRTEVSGEVV